MPNEDPVQEMTICHPPQREEINPGTSQLAWDLKLSGPMLQGVLFLIFLHFILYSFDSCHSKLS